MHDLFGGRVGIVSVAEINVQVIRAQAFQAAFDAMPDVFASQPAIVRVVRHRPVEFAGDHELLARVVFQDFAHDAFALAPGVSVGLIEEIHAAFQRDLNDPPRLLCVLDAAAEGRPAAQADG